MDDVITRILDIKEKKWTVLIGAVIVLLLIPSIPTLRGIIEDDGWVEGDDDSKGEISSQEELEEAYEGSQWEDNIGPNEFEKATNNDDDDDDENTDANPYCDLLTNEERKNVECHDRKDASETTGLYYCNDGTRKTDWRDCKDVSGYDYNSDNDNNLHLQSTPTLEFSPTENVLNPDGLMFGPFGIPISKYQPNTCDAWSNYLELRLNATIPIDTNSTMLGQEIIEFYAQCAKWKPTWSASSSRIPVLRIWKKFCQFVCEYFEVIYFL